MSEGHSIRKVESWKNHKLPPEFADEEIEHFRARSNSVGRRSNGSKKSFLETEGELLGKEVCNQLFMAMRDRTPLKDMLTTLAEVPDGPLKRAFENANEAYTAYEMDETPSLGECSSSSLIEGIVRPIVYHLTERTGDYPQRRLRLSAQQLLIIPHPTTEQPAPRIADFSVAILTDQDWVQFMSIECKRMSANEALCQSAIHLWAMRCQKHYPSNKPLYAICFGPDNWVLMKLDGKKFQMSKGNSTTFEQLPYPKDEKVRADTPNSAFKLLVQVVYTICAEAKRLKHNKRQNNNAKKANRKKAKTR